MPSIEHSLTLRVLESELEIVRLLPGAPLPDWLRGEFVSLTRTPEELSIVCESGSAPPDARAHGPWRCFSVKGPMEFSLTGVLNSLTSPLARAGIGIFAISTFDTDYLLVQSGDLRQAVEILSAAGHVIAEPVPGL